jgi:hypothetical protein
MSFMSSSGMGETPGWSHPLLLLHSKRDSRALA